MKEHKKITRALLSVTDKDGLEPLAAALARHGAELVSTGSGTTLRDAEQEAASAILAMLEDQSE